MIYILPIYKSIEKDGIVTAKDKDEVEPALWEEINSMMLQHNSSFAHNRFQVIEQLQLRNTHRNDSIFRIFIHNQALELFVPSRAELLLFHLHD